MLIMPSLKMIFVHLPKCGGTSVEVAFDRICKWMDIAVGGTEFGEILQPHYSAKFGLDKHSTAKDIIDVLGEQVWDEYYSWALVRSPYSRMLSNYNYAAREVSYHLKQVKRESSSPKDIVDWVNDKDFPGRKPGWPWDNHAIQAYLLTLNDEYPFSAYIRHPLFMATHWNWSLKAQLEDKSGESLAVKDFIRLEELAQEWPKLCDKLGVAGLDLPWENSSTKPREQAQHRFFWREDDVALIQCRFAEDFEVFGYSSSPPA